MCKLFDNLSLHNKRKQTNYVYTLQLEQKHFYVFAIARIVSGLYYNIIYVS